MKYGGRFWGSLVVFLLVQAIKRQAIVNLPVIFNYVSARGRFPEFLFRGGERGFVDN